ncbi:MAG: zeta toxin [Chitinophagaceae bacterium]|nr:zeta toxin [Chitinophagaceae bacterium]
MQGKSLYIIAGCNGSGKTTATFTILPDIIQCREFINADEIARGLSPFQPEKVSFEAGRIMLHRIYELLQGEESFAIETTLSNLTYKSTIIKAQSLGFKVSLIYFWLRNIELAKQRVQIRVQEGGHNIPPDLISRRYKRGLKNLLNLYAPIVNDVLLFDNSDGLMDPIASKKEQQYWEIQNENIWYELNNLVCTL